MHANTVHIMKSASHYACKYSTYNVTTLQDLLVNLAGKIEKIEKMMVKMMDILKNGPAGVAGAAGVKKEDEECIVSVIYH